MRFIQYSFICNLIFTFAFFLFGCDFPPEPLLKNNEPNIQNPTVVEIDSAKWLLPLNENNKWTFIVVATNGPMQPPTNAPIIVHKIGGEIFHEIRYLYTEKNPMNPALAFPPIMQNSNEGLHFFERTNIMDTTLSRLPKLLFTLPYPAPVGKVVSEPASDYSVRVVAKDTLISGHSTSLGAKCYRYDIFLGNKQKSTIYALPGRALLRIDTENLTFHTLSWRIE